ncbi:MAG: phosphoenolpyruvate--protein phosphotransferase [Rickettsiales bacterium]|nr:phosphoenolpyruvate--protein phosphotransferase [Rickettsiales bacterium]
MPELRIVTDEPSPLALLRDVRDVMTGTGSPQARLDRLVLLISDRLHSEVCSIYVMQPGQILELYATAGLNRSAIHSTRLAVGQGLVGEIAAEARPLNLSDAQNHPTFVYRPETGEERFQSFVGVPILTNHQVLGVLVVQSAAARIYSDEQLEVLQTVAMVIAELVVGQSLVDQVALTREKRISSLSHSFTGQALCGGLAKAPAVMHRPQIRIKELVTDDPAREETRLVEAIQAMQESVQTLISATDPLSLAHAEILETYQMLAQDRGWKNSIIQAIHTGLTAEAAAKKVMEDLHVRLEQAQNPYVRERIEDLEDVTTRLLYHLTGVSFTAAHSQLPSNFILVARSLGPAELLEYGHERIKGLVLEEGSAASHIAIIAKMMDIPVVARIRDATDIVQTGDVVVVDGDHGEVFIRPSDDLEAEITESLRMRAQRDAVYQASRGVPAMSKDGQRINMMLNIGLNLNARELSSVDIDGVGLFRTELPYLTASHFPTVENQQLLYAGILRQSHNKPVIFRTFDIGGDKPVPYIHIPPEENPAMGWRATRIGLDRPMLLRRQFRALLLAASGQVLHVMFPMIATAEEFYATRALLMHEYARLEANGDMPPKALRIGIMLEIPSMIFELPHILDQLQFISIGSNDLLQFLYAADRANDHLTKQYGGLRASVLGLLKNVVKQCQQKGVDVGFCGDMATRPLDAMALLGCGIRSLSVAPRAVGPLKAMIASLDVQALTDYLEFICKVEQGNLRGHLTSYALDHAIRV